MRKVFMSFLGKGSYDKKNDIYKYDPASYLLNGISSRKTEFVQVAELELLTDNYFDEVFILVTETSRNYHFDNLQSQMRDLDYTPVPIQVTEDLEVHGQWELFETILKYIEPYDRLTLDLTHGFRSMPIIFSTAINFLQKARNMHLDAVYYGAFDKNRDLSPIIDMKDFYLINDWADAVDRLVEDADAEKMLEVADKAPDFQTGGINDQDIINSIEELTSTIKNIDVDSVAEKTNRAINIIKDKEKFAAGTGQILLNLVLDKFTTLTTSEPLDRKYDQEYFRIQLEVIKLLLEHKFFMQAYTVMREFVASLAMIPFEMEGMNNKKRRKRRSKHAEIFVRMLQYDKWQFNEEEQKQVERLRPFYNRIREIGVESELKKFLDKLINYRNGFDHAWVTKIVAVDIEETGLEILGHLQNSMDILKNNDLMPLSR